MTPSGQRREKPVGGDRLAPRGGCPLDRIRAEQAQAAAELARGAPDRRGLEQCITDWLMEEAIVTRPRVPAS
jgi:hypothetical protein